MVPKVRGLTVFTERHKATEKSEPATTIEQSARRSKLRDETVISKREPALGAHFVNKQGIV